jgi:predicted DNA-binding protein
MATHTRRPKLVDDHRTTIRLPEELHRRVKAKAALEGRTFSAVLRELLEQWVSEDPPEEKIS